MGERRMNKNRNNHNEDQEDDTPFLLSAKPLGIEYSVFINEAFSHPKQFEYIVQAMDNSSPEDVFSISLTTPGGALHAVLPLLGAIKNTSSYVHVHACSDVASAGTLLLMAADSVSLNDYVEIMFHQVRFGAVGEGWNVERQVEHTLKASKKLMRDSYKHFLSNDEIEKMLTGTPFYMDKDEFIERYQKRAQLLSEEAIEQRACEECENVEVTKKPRKPRAKKTKDADVIPVDTDDVIL